MIAPRACALVLACAAACATTRAPRAPTVDAVDAHAARQLEQLHVPGLAVAIVVDGRVVHAKGYGHADLEHQVPVTPATVFELGSVTKQFTAAAVLQLADAGLLGLDEPVVRYLDGAPAAWQAITLRHLLGHRGGIQNHVGVPGFLDTFTTSPLGTTAPGRDDLLRRFYALPLEFPANTSWAYDNTGYYLLGVIVERVTGRSFWEVLDERVLGPAGLRTARSTEPAPLVAHRAAGYAWTKDGYRNRPALPPFVALSAGALMASLDDLIRWDAALARGGVVARPEVMWQATPLADGSVAPIDYGMGWFVDTYHGKRIALHGGGTPGFSCTVVRFLDDRVTVIVLANHGDRMLDQLAIDLAGLAVPALRRPEASPDPDPARTARLERVVRALLRGEVPADERFTPALRTFLGTVTGRGFWQWPAEHGALTRFVFSEQEAVGGDVVVRYRVWLGDDPYWLSIRLAADGTISQLRWW